MIEEQQLRTENQKYEYNSIIYLINEEENTTSVIGSKVYQQIYIPRSIKYGPNEYIVISIGEGAFSVYTQLNTVEIPEDSKLETIDKNSFCYSTIKNIKIPSSVKIIKEGAFSYCKQIETIEIPEDSKLETIDKNSFCYSTIKNIRIPSSVKIIKEGAFSYCKQIETIEIPEDSKLETIEKNVFSYSNIKSITIPSKLINLKEEWCKETSNLTEIIVSPNNPRYCLYENKLLLGKTKIEDNNYENLIFCARNIKHIKIPDFIKHICSRSFESCKQLETIEIPEDSKLETIERKAFYWTKIEKITIPSELVNLKEEWCKETSNLTEIIVSPNNPRYCLYENKLLLGKTKIEDNNYENLIFCVRNIKHIKIPNFIKHICSYSFESCQQLETIEIPEDSKLETIERKAFYRTKIEKITIPSKLVNLKEEWCKDTSYLIEIIVSPNNPRYCLYENKLLLGKTKIEDNNYENLIFCVRNIKHVKIPNFIKHICSYSFECQQLETIEIPEDSKLETIGKYAFLYSKIEKFKIPSSVTLIEKYALSCFQLHQIEIPEDSKLQTIENFAFSLPNLESITIPSSVTLIEENAFSGCEQLQIIEINKIEMIPICDTLFKDCKKALLMIPVHSNL